MRSRSEFGIWWRNIAFRRSSSERASPGPAPFARADSIAAKSSRIGQRIRERASSASARRREFSSVASTFESHQETFLARVSGSSVSSAERISDSASLNRPAPAAAAACL